MKLTVKELQEKSYSFLFDGQGITGTIRVGMIGNCAFSIDDLAGTVYVKRNVLTDKELNDFLELDQLLDNDGIEEMRALKFDDLSGLDIEEVD